MILPYGQILSIPIPSFSVAKSKQKLHNCLLITTFIQGCLAQKEQDVFIDTKNFATLRNWCLKQRLGFGLTLRYQNKKASLSGQSLIYMARPKKTVKREKQYSVRLTLAEAKRIEKNAGRYGLSVSSYLRKKGLNDKIKPLWTSEEKEAYRQLVGIANNLNQLTRYTHQKKLITGEILKALELVNKAIDKFK